MTNAAGSSKKCQQSPAGNAAHGNLVDMLVPSTTAGRSKVASHGIKRVKGSATIQAGGEQGIHSR